jgi:thiol-disulfide isomerase/thioredoxin
VNSIPLRSLELRRIYEIVKEKYQSNMGMFQIILLGTIAPILIAGSMQMEAKPKVYAPEIYPGEWINSESLTLKDLRGKVVLIDFWEYTCINCIRTFPYIKEWHNRYKDEGLVIIGIHAPEFKFGHNIENVKHAVEKFDLQHPIVLDNQFRTWKAYANRYWPAKYLIDQNGVIRYQNYGEGSYGETEKEIQTLLKEVNPDLDFPAPMSPIRPTDVPGAVCYRTTPELYLGYKRGRIGNKEGYRPGELVNYTLPNNTEEDIFYLQGKWLNDSESIRFSGNGKGLISLRYSAAEVNLVIKPEDVRDGFKVYISQDGKPLSKKNRGDDVEFDANEDSYLFIDEPKMYRLIKNSKYGTYQLKLTTETKGFAAFAFTFVTACVTPDNKN